MSILLRGTKEFLAFGVFCAAICFSTPAMAVTGATTGGESTAESLSCCFTTGSTDANGCHNLKCNGKTYYICSSSCPSGYSLQTAYICCSDVCVQQPYCALSLSGYGTNCPQGYYYVFTSSGKTGTESCVRCPGNGTTRSSGYNQITDCYIPGSKEEVEDNSGWFMMPDDCYYELNSGGIILG